MNRRPVILASSSPRRQQILKEAGIEFTLRTKDIPENYPSSLPKGEVPLFLARLKAEAFRHEIKDEVVITADTVVILGDEILGKPHTEENAIAMLRKLSGNTHKVITGVCLLTCDQDLTFAETTLVYFKTLTDKEIRDYVAQYKPLDKAGAYGIQERIGMIGIEKIEGSYFNVVGLPVARVYEELKKLGAGF